MSRAKSRRQQFLDALEAPDPEEPPHLDRSLEMFNLSIKEVLEPTQSITPPPRLEPVRKIYFRRQTCNPQMSRAIKKDPPKKTSCKRSSSSVSIQHAIKIGMAPKRFESLGPPLTEIQKQFLSLYCLKYQQETGTFEFTLHSPHSEKNGHKRKSSLMIPEIRVFAPEDEPAAKIHRPEPIHPCYSNLDGRQFLHPHFALQPQTPAINGFPQNLVDLSRLLFLAQQVKQPGKTTGFTIKDLIAPDPSK